MDFEKLTEAASPYRHLENMSTLDLLKNINMEDQQVAQAVGRVLPMLEFLVQSIVNSMLSGGRLFYMGAGTSGRLGILDASECVPTFGVEPGLVIGIIAGGKKAMTNAVEFAEDNEEQGWRDLLAYNITNADFVIGLSASGTTPYVMGALKACKSNQVATGSICCNAGAPISDFSDFPVEIVTGPEFITGSTRMKAGTAQKMALNMLSTAVMVRLGRIQDNKMVNMQLTNEKLVDRGVKMAMEALDLTDYAETRKLLMEAGSVRKLVDNYRR